MKKFTEYPIYEEYDHSWYTNRSATSAEKSDYFEQLHSSSDRSCYDTPGSVRNCPCDDCNAVRKTYGVAPVNSKIMMRVEHYSNNGDYIGYMNKTAFLKK